MADPLILQARPLTADAFAAFGDVVEMAGHTATPMNQGWAQRYHNLAQVDVRDHSGEVGVSLARAQPETAPVTLRLLERHPFGSQIFMPLGSHPFLVVVGPAGDVPAREALLAFVSNGRQGVNYHKGVWHHPMIALEAESDFLIVDRRGPGDNCDEAEISGGDVVVQL